MSNLTTYKQAIFLLDALQLLKNGYNKQHMKVKVTVTFYENRKTRTCCQWPNMIQRI